jgi:type III restriction enzyme
VRLASDVTLVLEVKGFEDNQTKAKHDAAKRWVMAVNNWGQLSRWDFHVCRNPLPLGKELTYILRSSASPSFTRAGDRRSQPAISIFT